MSGEHSNNAHNYVIKPNYSTSWAYSRPEALILIDIDKESRQVCQNSHDHGFLDSGQKYTHRGQIGDAQGMHRASKSDDTPSWSLALSKQQVESIVDNYHRGYVKEFLEEAVRRNNQVFQDGPEPGEYLSPCWSLASELRGHPIFAGCGGAQIARKVDGLIDWNALPDSDVFGGESVDPRDELIDTINYQNEHEIQPLCIPVAPSVAHEYAISYPITSPDVKSAYTKAVSIFFWLAALLKQDGWFFLATRTLADLIACSPRPSNQYIRRAVSEGFIKKERSYDRGLRQANEYRWIGDNLITFETG